MAFVADALVILALVVITLGVVGMFRMPDIYTRLHAAAKSVFLGIIALLAASMVVGDDAIAARAVLIAGFLILTTPVGAHVIALAAYQRGEGMATPGAVDESGAELTETEPSAEEQTPG